MAPNSLRERHYAKISGLVRRNARDLTPEDLDQHALAKAMLEKISHGGLGSPKLVSSAHGVISQLLLTIPSYAANSGAGETNPLAATYIDLLAKLPRTIKYIVLTHDSSAVTVAQWFADLAIGDVDIITVGEHLNFSIWAEDGYVVATDSVSQRTFFVEPFSFPRYADGLIADFVSNSSSLGNTQAPLYFQGGNILIGDDFFFVGADYPAKSLDYIKQVIVPDPGETPVATVRRLYRTYLDSSKDLYYVGSSIPVPAQLKRTIVIDGQQWIETLYAGNHAGTTQPLFHIDMFITLAGRDGAGKYQVFVGDPSLAAEALGIPLWPHAMQGVFDNISQYLESLGFRVLRNPLPLAYIDDPSTKQRTWYFATSNNALVQILPSGGKSVWLPAYGFGGWQALTTTDQINVKAWEAIGFKATLLSDFHPFAENLGAVHCIKKYLART